MFFATLPLHHKANEEAYVVYYLRVRDCCECFVFKYTHVLTVQWTRNFQYCTKRSWVQYWKLRDSQQSLTLLIFNPSSLLAIDLQWLPARPVWMRKQWKEKQMKTRTYNGQESLIFFNLIIVNCFSNSFLLTLGKSWTWSHVRLNLKNTAQFLCVIIITHSFYALL